MIRLNLIDAAERLTAAENVAPVNVTSVADLRKKSRKKALTAALAALFVVVAFSCFLSVAGVPAPLQGILPAPYLSLIGAEDPSRSALTMGDGQRTSAGGMLEAQAAAAEAAIKRRDAVTVKQVVGEINPQVLFNNKRSEYNSFLPLEKISYQKAFLDRIRAVSTDFRTPPLPENAPATDITAFGKFGVVNVNLQSVSSFVPTAEVAAEVKSLKALAVSNKVQLTGLDKPTVEEFGVYKRYSYKVTTPADFSDLQAFIAAYATSPLRIGVQNVEMKQAKRDLFSTIRFEMFVIK